MNDNTSRKPTERQQQIIGSKAQLTVVAAGPGSGKSQTLAWRVQRLIADGVAPHKIVILSFTNAAAEVITERIGVPVGFSGTLHGYILRLLTCHGESIGFPKSFTILDQEESEGFLQSQLKSLNLKNVPKKELRAALSKGPIRGAPITPLSLAVNAYYQKLQATGTLDYDSMLVFGLKVATKLQADGVVLGEHLLTDESQDSGDLDFEIYRRLPFKFKTLIGDADQSVYSFRGGNPKHLLDACRNKQANVIALETNFRSDVSICAAANRLIKHNADRFDKLTIPFSTQDGEVRVMPPFETAAHEARWLASDIMHVTDGKPEHLREVAVLCRTNHLVEEFSLALGAAGIPVSKTTAPPAPLDWAKTRLLLALLCNPENDHLAKKWLKENEGNFEAESTERFALSALTSINQSHLHLEIPSLENVTSVLRKYLIGEQSIALVDEAMEKLPDLSSIHNLALAITQQWMMNTTEGEGVTVGTIHSAKGREFDCVYLPAAEDQIIPGTRKSMDVEEERRIFFVAITRARHRLVVSTALKRVPKFGPRVPEPATVSRYVAEMMG